MLVRLVGKASVPCGCCFEDISRDGTSFAIPLKLCNAFFVCLKYTNIRHERGLEGNPPLTDHLSVSRPVSFLSAEERSLRRSLCLAQWFFNRRHFSLSSPLLPSSPFPSPPVPSPSLPSSPLPAAGEARRKYEDATGSFRQHQPRMEVNLPPMVNTREGKLLTVEVRTLHAILKLIAAVVGFLVLAAG